MMKERIWELEDGDDLSLSEMLELKSLRIGLGMKDIGEIMGEYK